MQHCLIFIYRQLVQRFDTGIHLTFVTNSGSGTILTMDDAGYFSDGFGIVDADWIKIGSTDPVEIASIDYDTNIINTGQSRNLE